MKIVQALGWYFPDAIGGTEVYVEALAREFRERGHQVLIAAPRAGASGSETATHQHVPVFRYPIPATPSRDEAQGRAVVRGAEAFHRWLSEVRPDVVHVHTFVTGLGLNEIEAARAAGARVVVTTHSSSLGFVCQRGTLMWRGETLCDGFAVIDRCAACDLEARGVPRAIADVAGRIPVPISRAIGSLPGRFGTAAGMPELIDWNQRRQARLFELVDRFVVLTDRARSIVLANQAPSEKVVVNRLGVSQSPSRIRPAARTTPSVTRIGYVGRFDSIKGVLALANAMRAVPGDVPVHLEFRGPINSPADAQVRDQIGRLCAADSRVAVGNGVPSCEVADLMRTYDVACFPSQCLEGGPTAGLEAIAAGTPVIASTSSGLAEILTDGVSGRLVPPGDTAALARAIVEAARNPAMVSAWRERLPQVRTMRDVASDYLDLYAA